MGGEGSENDRGSFLKVTDIALGMDHSLALTSTGQVFSWGSGFFAIFPISPPKLGLLGVIRGLFTGVNAHGPSVLLRII